MTPQERKIFVQALEALEREARGYAVHDELQIPRSIRDAIVAIKEVLAQPELKDEKGRPMTYWGGMAQPEPPPECPMDSYGDGNTYRGQRSKDSVVKTITLAQQEPVAWLSKGGKGIWFHEPDASLNATPLYTTPPQRKPLTDEQKMALCKQFPDHLTFNAIHAIEAAHGI